MTWDFRQHLQADLKTTPEISAKVARVYAGERPLETALPALVWRCTKLTRGEDVDGDDGTREANVELVIWAKDLEAGLPIRDAILGRYHAPHGYDFGGSESANVEPLEMGSSRCTNEYDGDRVSDTYAMTGSVALTVELNFMWVEL